MRTIIAIGGGGFGSPEPTELPALLRQEVPGVNPRIGFLPTASGDSESYIAGFLAHAEALAFEPRVFSLFRTDLWQPELPGELMKCQAIYVGGGNTRNMLHLWQLWGVTQALRDAYEAGIPLMGVSAGAICWFEQGNTDSLGPQLSVLDCLGWLPGSCTPHFDEEPERRPTLERQLAAGEIKSGVALTRGAGLVYEDELPVRLLKGNPEARVYSVAPSEPWCRPLFT